MTAPKKRRLSHMIIKEISLVDDGMNQHARVAIVKAKDAFKHCDECSGGTAPMCKKNGKCVGTPDKMKKALIEKMGVLFAEFPAEVVVGALAEGFSADPDADHTAAAFLKELHMNVDELSKALKEAEDKIAAVEKRATEAEAVVKAKDAKIAELETTISKGAPRKTAEQEDEEFLKSLPAGARDRILADRKAAAEAVEAVNKMREERDTEQAIEKARVLKVGDAAVVGPLLVRVAKGKTTAEDAKTLEGVLKAAGAQIASGALFASVGSTVAVDGDPEALLKAKAEEIKKAKPTLSIEQAYDQACQANPQLYNAYVAKRRPAAAAH